jgi:Cas7 group CRISPR-associated protein Csh2
MTATPAGTIRRGTGLLVIEVKNSNPNGDPDRESDPRVRSHDQRGMITGVSFKRKLRDLVDYKDGDVWKEKGERLPAAEFDILEARRHPRREIDRLLREDFEKFKNRFWDARVFGNTFLEQEIGDTIRTGVAQFGIAVSVSPVRVDRMTITKMAPAQGGGEGEGPSRGMAPLGVRIVQHGVYVMPFFINPTAAGKSGCRERDVKLLLALIPYAYPHSKSVARPMVEVRHAWYAEHANSLGSFSEFRFVEAMTPRRKGDPEKPSTGNMPLEEEYDVPKDLPDDLKGRVAAGSFRDLCA